MPACKNCVLLWIVISFLICVIVNNTFSWLSLISLVSFEREEHLEPNSTTRTTATNTGYEHQHWTPPTDKLTTILQQICRIAMSEPNISTCQNVGMWQIFVRWWCSLVVFVAGVRPCSGVWLLTVKHADCPYRAAQGPQWRGVGLNKIHQRCDLLRWYYQNFMR